MWTEYRMLFFWLITTINVVAESQVQSSCPLYAPYYCTCSMVDDVAEIKPVRMCLYQDSNGVACRPCLIHFQDNISCHSCPHNSCPICSLQNFGMKQSYDDRQEHMNGSQISGQQIFIKFTPDKGILYLQPYYGYNVRNESNNDTYLPNKLVAVSVHSQDPSQNSKAWKDLQKEYYFYSASGRKTSQGKEVGYNDLNISKSRSGRSLDPLIREKENRHTAREEADKRDTMDKSLGSDSLHVNSGNSDAKLTSMSKLEENSKHSKSDSEEIFPMRFLLLEPRLVSKEPNEGVINNSLTVDESRNGTHFRKSKNVRKNKNSEIFKKKNKKFPIKKFRRTATEEQGGRNTDDSENLSEQVSEWKSEVKMGDNKTPLSVHGTESMVGKDSTIPSQTLKDSFSKMFLEMGNEDSFALSNSDETVNLSTDYVPSITSGLTGFESLEQALIEKNMTTEYNISEQQDLKNNQFPEDDKCFLKRSPKNADTQSSLLARSYDFQCWIGNNSRRDISGKEFFGERKFLLNKTDIALIYKEIEKCHSGSTAKVFNIQKNLVFLDSECNATFPSGILLKLVSGIIKEGNADSQIQLMQSFHAPYDGSLVDQFDIIIKMDNFVLKHLNTSNKSSIDSTKMFNMSGQLEVRMKFYLKDSFGSELKLFLNDTERDKKLLLEFSSLVGDYENDEQFYSSARNYSKKTEPKKAINLGFPKDFGYGKFDRNDSEQDRPFLLDHFILNRMPGMSQLPYRQKPFMLPFILVPREDKLFNSSITSPENKLVLLRNDADPFPLGSFLDSRESKTERERSSDRRKQISKSSLFNLLFDLLNVPKDEISPIALKNLIRHYRMNSFMRYPFFAANPYLLPRSYAKNSTSINTPKQILKEKIKIIEYHYRKYLLVPKTNETVEKTFLQDQNNSKFLDMLNASISTLKKLNIFNSSCTTCSILYKIMLDEGFKNDPKWTEDTNSSYYVFMDKPEFVFHVNMSNLSRDIKMQLSIPLTNKNVSFIAQINLNLLFMSSEMYEQEKISKSNFLENVEGNYLNTKFFFKIPESIISQSKLFSLYDSPRFSNTPFSPSLFVHDLKSEELQDLDELVFALLHKMHEHRILNDFDEVDQSDGTESYVEGEPGTSEQDYEELNNLSEINQSDIYSMNAPGTNELLSEDDVNMPISIEEIENSGRHFREYNASDYDNEGLNNTPEVNQSVVTDEVEQSESYVEEENRSTESYIEEEEAGTSEQDYEELNNLSEISESDIYSMNLPGINELLSEADINMPLSMEEIENLSRLLKEDNESDYGSEGLNITPEINQSVVDLENLPGVDSELSHFADIDAEISINSEESEDGTEPRLEQEYVTSEFGNQILNNTSEVNESEDIALNFPEVDYELLSLYDIEKSFSNDEIERGTWSHLKEDYTIGYDSQGHKNTLDVNQSDIYSMKVFEADSELHGHSDKKRSAINKETKNGTKNGYSKRKGKLRGTSSEQVSDGSYVQTQKYEGLIGQMRMSKEANQTSFFKMPSGLVPIEYDGNVAETEGKLRYHAGLLDWNQALLQKNEGNIKADKSSKKHTPFNLNVSDVVLQDLENALPEALAEIDESENEIPKDARRFRRSLLFDTEDENVIHFSTNDLEMKSRRKRDIPQNDWCMIEKMIRNADLSCTIWSHKKACLLKCHRGYTISGKSQQDFSCGRKFNTWDSYMGACEGTSAAPATPQRALDVTTQGQGGKDDEDADDRNEMNHGGEYADDDYGNSENEPNDEKAEPEEEHDEKSEREDEDYYSEDRDEGEWEEYEDDDASES